MKMDIIQEKFKDVPKIMTPNESDMAFFQIDVGKDDLLITFNNGRYIAGSLKAIIGDYIDLLQEREDEDE